MKEGARDEALGPFWYGEKAGSVHSWAIPPLLSSVSDPETDSREFDFLYPILTYDRFGLEYRVQLVQLISFSGGGTQSGEVKDQINLFPIYFHQHSANSNENYTALFPIYGHLKNRLFRDEIDFFLWPVYVKTKRKPGAGTVGAEEFLSLGYRWAQARRGDVTTYNFLAPIFHLRYGDGMHGWQAWPLAGHEIKVQTTRTNAWNELETVPGYEKSFFIWPIWSKETTETGTTNTRNYSTFLPFYVCLRSPARDSTSYLWPVGLTCTDDRARKYRETDLLWPVFSFARGEGKTVDCVWPLFGNAYSKELKSVFFLWPLYKYKHQKASVLDRERTQVLFFLYSDVAEMNTATGASSHRVDFWPLFSKTHDSQGHSRLQVLSLLEPIFSKSPSIERNYSPLWSIWRSEQDTQTGASSQSFLWNLYRHQRMPGGGSSTSCLFGLFKKSVSGGESVVRVFYIPIARHPVQPAAAVIDSGDKMAHFEKGNQR